MSTLPWRQIPEIERRAILAEAAKLREGWHLSWDKIAEKLHVSVEALQRALRPGYAENRRAKIRAARKNHPQARKPRKMGTDGGLGTRLRNRVLYKQKTKPVPMAKQRPLPANAVPVRLMDVTSIYDQPGQRRYVIGDPRGPDTLFCGAPIFKHSFCEYHHGICWTRAERHRPPVDYSTKEDKVAFGVF